MGKNKKEMQVELKTNVIRLLEQAKIPYQQYSYGDGEAISGTEVARVLGLKKEQVFKTLVTEGKSREHYVFVIPVALELNLKKAAKAVGEKSIEMIKSKELLPLTGYLHGGCSPIGMKKRFVTVLHETAAQWETIIFSAGRIGLQVEIKPEDLKKMVPYTFEDVADNTDTTI